MNYIRGRLFAVGCVLAVGSAMAACGGNDASSGAGGLTVATVPPTPAAMAPATDSPCRDSAVTNREVSTGSALRATVVAATASFGALDFVLPAGVQDQFPEIAAGERWKTSDTGADTTDTFYRALAAGAFIYGHPFISVQFENRSDAAVRIFDLRPANTQSVCMPTGLLATYGTEGGDPVPMVFNLDADRPVALVPVADGEIPGRPYFQAHSIEIAAGSTEWVVMDFILAKRARAFDLAASYISGGGKYTLLVRQGDQPFRATPRTCPMQEDRALLTDDDMRRLSGHRFNSVLVQGDTLPNGMPSMKEMSPDAFAQDCMTR